MLKYSIQMFMSEVKVWLHCLFDSIKTKPKPLHCVAEFRASAKSQSQVRHSLTGSPIGPALFFPSWGPAVTEWLYCGNQSYVYSESLNSFCCRYFVNTDTSRKGIYHVDINWKFANTDATNTESSCSVVWVNSLFGTLDYSECTVNQLFYKNPS